jgi:hypothetical protein
MEVVPLEHHEVLVMRRWSVEPLPRDEIAAAYNLSPKDRTIEFHLAAGHWRLVLDSAAAQWEGPGQIVAADVTIDGAMKFRLMPWSLMLWQRIGLTALAEQVATSGDIRRS